VERGSIFENVSGLKAWHRRVWSSYTGRDLCGSARHVGTAEPLMLAWPSAASQKSGPKDRPYDPLSLSSMQWNGMQRKDG